MGPGMAGPPQPNGAFRPVGPPGGPGQVNGLAPGGDVNGVNGRHSPNFPPSMKPPTNGQPPSSLPSVSAPSNLPPSQMPPGPLPPQPMGGPLPPNPGGPPNSSSQPLGGPLQPPGPRPGMGFPPTTGAKMPPQPSMGGPPRPGMGPPQPSMAGPPQPGMGPPQPGMGGPPQSGMGPPQPGMGSGMPPQPGMGMPPQPGMGMPPQPGKGMPPQPGMGQGMPPQHGMGPGGYPGGGYPGGGMQQPQKKGLDPDSMPNPIQVMADDRAAHPSGQFVTNEKGKMPPLVTTNFTTIDQGNSGPRMMRSTMYSVPDQPDMKKQTSVPLGLVMTPLAEPGPGEYPTPVVNLGDLGPVRCLRCKAYMSPFMTFTDGGKRFQCVFCKATTEVPAEYFQHLDHTGQRMDKYERPELCLGSYEFTATKDYCRDNKMPSPPGILFAIDVSYPMLKEGIVQLICQNMKDILRNLPVDTAAGETKR